MLKLVKAVLCVGAVLAALSTVASAEPPTVLREFKVPISGSAKIFRPRISGDWIIINRTGENGNDPVLAYDVYNFKTKSTSTTLNTGHLPWGEFSGREIVYADPSNSSQIDLYDIATGRQRVIPVSYGPVFKSVPVAYGNFVAYKGKNGQIYGVNTLNGAEGMLSSGVGQQNTPHMGGNLVVWTDTSGAKPQIRAFNFATNQQLVILCNPETEYVLPSTDGKTIVCEAKGQGLMAYDINTGKWTKITGCGYFSDIDNGYVAFQQGNAVYVYEIATGTQLKVSSTPTVNNGPSISGNHVIWGTQDDVYCAELSIPAAKPLPSVHKPKVKIRG